MTETEDERGHAEDPDDGGELDDQQGPAVAPVRGQKKQLVKARSEELAEWHLAQGQEPGDPVEVVFRGDRIGSDGGAASVIGATLQRLANLIGSIGGGDPYVEALTFANSVHILLRPRKDELERARADFRRGVELRESRREAGMVVDDPTVRRLLEASVPDVEVASALAADLLSVSAEEAPAAAVRFGSEVAQAYKTLANTVAKNELTIELTPPGGGDPVRLGAQKAAMVNDALRDVTEPRRYEITVYGTLSIRGRHPARLRPSPGPRPRPPSGDPQEPQAPPRPLYARG